jgi:type I restriction enzyme S subunit
MLNWTEFDFLDTIQKIKIGRDQQAPSSGIVASGLFPVIDQGQTFIAGYHNDESKVIRDCLPVVIFGDHTRCFKFVDFPFILGTDGTKVLKPKEELFDPKFFYFFTLKSCHP